MIEVRPYTFLDGIPTLRDSEIAGLFDLMVRDGTDSVVFYDGFIRNSDQFVRFIKYGGNLLFVAVEDEKPLACGWLNHIENMTAQAHFCFFSEIWDHRSIEVGKLLVQKAMDISGLKMFIGLVPENNPAAAKFAVKCGAKVLGTLPFGCMGSDGRPMAATLVYYVR